MLLWGPPSSSEKKRVQIFLDAETIDATKPEEGGEKRGKT